ncbi:MAG: aminotransferase class I/II-fold pyridoxal phosphate-dependent enzyme [Verrucomicrobiae bacterium]|nr:aminotransferase class I/II-fold pyridoxal phosphate-dependent enzyme [Verrucomicrobiae bacterium]
MDFEKALARHVRGIPRSGIRDFFDVVQNVPDVVSLGIGEPGFVTPWRIREAAIYALERGRTGYTSNLGLLRLREAVAGYLERTFGLAYDPTREILVTVGVSEGMDIALRAILNPGDEVLYHEPCYVSYHPGVALAHGTPVAVPATSETQFAPRVEEFANRVTPRTRAILLNFPTNPTGGTVDAAWLKAMAALAVKHDLLVLTDEIYAELTYEGRHLSIAALPGMRDRTLFFHGFSKAWAMTGFRLGYVCAPPPIVEAMMRVHQYSMLCAPILSQEAAVEAVKNGDADVERMRDEYRLRRNYLVSELRGMGLDCHLPRGAFYAFPSIRSTEKKSRDFALGLLKEQKVAVVPGDAFGASGEGHVRACFAAPMEDIEKAVERMKRFVGGKP